MNRRIGWGLIGASNIARQRVAGAIRHSREGALVAIVSHDLKLARDFAAEFDIPQAFDTLEPLLSDPGVQAVYVSSTNQHHPRQVLAAAAAGRHVLCEKPLAASLDEAVAMQRACRAAGVLLATNHHLRNAVTLRAMRDEIARGAIGTPRTVLASHPAWVPDGDWRRTNPAAGAGVCLDILVHTADAVRFVLGREALEACALGSTSTLMPAEGPYDLIMASYRFEGGALAQLCADFNDPHGRSRLEVHGSDGVLIGTDVLGKGAHRGRLVRRLKGTESEIAVESDDSRYLAAIERFHAAIAGSGTPAATGVDGIRSLAMALAAQQAAASGRTVAVSRAGLELP
ncbi:MAG: Gfo/Idh/MocA family oxidoreductase [Proteobacteria bacterium]|nr:Gfo/Idh/MocA family oxidoreductase [Pseudomonadota bacterium]